ncbi:hypothetical protein [Sandarakinorhabdus sp.]|uniref:hypothetical protein n=1 Tax=Sandarakinorhabdus sp. TaxID=1916663 RepID=UPI003F6F54EA
MTALTPETASAILASHGADPVRWPAEHRAALLALAASDAAVAAALVEAQRLDAMLADWAAAPAPLAGIDAAAIAALPQQRPAPPQRATGWRPALLAASLALVVAVGGWLGFADQFTAQPQTRIVIAAPPSAGVVAGEADLVFAYVFTPTAAEEDLI